MKDDRGIIMEVGRGECMEPGKEGDVEMHEGGYWNVGLCTGVGGSGGVGGRVGGDDANGVVVLALLAVVVETVVVQGILVEIDRVWEWYLSRVVGFLWWWWCWRILDLCCGLAGRWLWGVGMRGGLFVTFQSDVSGREHVWGSMCVSFWKCDLMWICGFFGFFIFFRVVGGSGVVLV